MELLLLIHTLKLCSCKRITVCWGFFRTKTGDSLRKNKERKRVAPFTTNRFRLHVARITPSGCYPLLRLCPSRQETQASRANLGVSRGSAHRNHGERSWKTASYIEGGNVTLLIGLQHTRNHIDYISRRWYCIVPCSLFNIRNRLGSFSLCHLRPSCWSGMTFKYHSGRYSPYILLYTMYYITIPYWYCMIWYIIFVR